MLTQSQEIPQLVNLYQTKLGPCELVDADKPGLVGVLTFLLVAPMDNTIVSTAQVRPQQAHWIQQARGAILRQIGLPEIAEALVLAFAREGMTVDEAKEYRKHDVAERKCKLKEGDVGAEFLQYHESETSQYYWATGKRPKRMEGWGFEVRHSLVPDVPLRGSVELADAHQTNSNIFRRKRV